MSCIAGFVAKQLNVDKLISKVTNMLHHVVSYLNGKQLKPPMKRLSHTGILAEHDVSSLSQSV